MLGGHRLGGVAHLVAPAAARLGDVDLLQPEHVGGELGDRGTEQPGPRARRTVAGGRGRPSPSATPCSTLNVATRTPRLLQVVTASVKF